MLRRVLVFSIACALPLMPPFVLGQSRWVYPGPHGTLIYTHSSTGDRIPDFSFAGYAGGGVAIPNVLTRVKVVPSGGDDTSAIQTAIDEIAKLPLKDGIRGAVELGPGIFQCSGTLNITDSGVLLRGSGKGNDGTTLNEIGDPRLAIAIGGKLNVTPTNVSTHLTDDYVPFGATVIHVQSGAGFNTGDIIRITKPVTAEWVKMMGMDALERPGRNEHWVAGHLTTRRRIASVSGNTITLEVALMDSYDQKYVGAGAVKVDKVEVSGQVAKVGVENLRVVAPARSGSEHDPHSEGLNINDAADSWVRNVDFVDNTQGMTLNAGTERITIQQVDVTQHKFVTSPAKPFDFSISGSQILLDRCSGTGDSVFYVATEAKQQGPVVVLHSIFHGNGHLEPHQRWSTGLLIDSTSVPEGEIDLMNRGTMGSGHGWAIGWSVSWNNTAAVFTIQQAPGTLTWSIGDIGKQQQIPMPTSGSAKGPPLPFGEIESPGEHVLPASLYLQQLYERLGAKALKNIGYDPSMR
jgi:hypothetical protein